jgi:REP element-mobilizing transposase RayT
MPLVRDLRPAAGGGVSRPAASPELNNRRDAAGQRPAASPPTKFMTLQEAQRNGNLFFLTIKSIDGLPILINEKYYQIILDSLKFCRRHKGWRIYAYAILINHLHLVLKLLKGFSLSDTMRDFKKYTSNQILKRLKEDKQYDLLEELKIAANKTKDRNSKVWRHDCWPKIIVTEKFFFQKVQYTDFNAQKHGLVGDMEKYPYTSYHNHYCGHEAVLEIDNIAELF